MLKNLIYSNWENSFSLENQDLKLTIVPAIGARIHSLKYKGLEFFRQNAASLGKLAIQGEGWPNWGGSFDWIGPQSSWNDAGWPPPFELDSGCWQVIATAINAIELASSPCNLGIRLSKNIILENNTVTIVRTLTNASEKVISCALWNIVQVTTEGIIKIPASSQTLRSLKIFDWPPVQGIEGLKLDGIVVISDLHEHLCINPGLGKFKLGLLSEIGTIEYHLNNCQMSMVSSSVSAADYPHQCNIEIYRDDQSGYTELEQLWEMIQLQPGASFCASQAYVFQG